MALLVAILFEEPLEESYIAIQLDGPEPEILFTKGPSFTKTMGPFPIAYARATFERWQYCLLENPPEVRLTDPASLRETILHTRRQDARTARHVPDSV